METILTNLVGKRADIYCGSTSVFRGRLEDVGESVVRLIDDSERIFYIDIGSIIAASEVVDPGSRPGFLS